MFSPPLRAVLWKSIGLALALIVVVGIALDRLIVQLVGAGSASLETTLGPQAHAAGERSGLAAVDCRRPRHRRRQRFPDAGGDRRRRQFFRRPRSATKSNARIIRPIRPARRCRCGLRSGKARKTALLAVVIYLCAAPFMLFAGFGAVIFFLATAYILGREYFELAAMRFRPPAEAKLLRKRHAGDGLYRRPVHRRLRLDPDRQSGDAAVRHGVDGAHAQAARRARARSLVARFPRKRNQGTRWLGSDDGGAQRHTSSASSTTIRSFAHCSSSASTLPSSVEAKPHCGDRRADRAAQIWWPRRCGA